MLLHRIATRYPGKSTLWPEVSSKRSWTLWRRRRHKRLQKRYSNWQKTNSTSIYTMTLTDTCELIETPSLTLQREIECIGIFDCSNFKPFCTASSTPDNALCPQQEMCLCSQLDCGSSGVSFSSRPCVTNLHGACGNLTFVTSRYGIKIQDELLVQGIVYVY